ncbi:MAG: Ig-like domain-containing protein [Bacteroidetes bacterium]|nr:Ig-like domain-containing protein [Bacteroidota bacterium]
MTHCAQESTPQGGKKDESPPEARKIDPPNKSVRFQSNKIEITFNEFIQSSGFAQTLISPPLDRNPDYKVSGKKLKIKLKSLLRANTTYTINFGDDIKDVNESNISPNFTYVFSTGEYIDSQEVSGKITLAKDNSPAEGVLVTLYPAEMNDGILTNKPYYFSKTNKSGEYQIRNIKWGDYQIYALKDQNFNYIYDQPNELIGFQDTILHLTDSSHAKMNLVAFEAANKKVAFIRAKSINPGLVQFVYSAPINSFNLTYQGVPSSDFWYFNNTKDTVNYWLADYYSNNITLFPVANDSLLDTVRIELQNIAKDSMFQKKTNALSLTAQQIRPQTSKESLREITIQELYKPLKINFSRPISKINASKVLQILEDSTKKVVTPNFKLDEQSKTFLTADFQKKENTDYTLLIPDSSFQDIYGTWNYATTYHFRTNTKSEYGNIHLTLMTTGANPIIFFN